MNTFLPRFAPVLLALAFLLHCTSVRGLQIAEKGKAKCVIILAAGASSAEQTAATELAEYLKKSTGGTFDVKSPLDAPADVGQIVVGTQTADTRSLGTEGIIIKSDANHLLLTGGQPRGTLNAVTTFLEDRVGVRWWTSSEESVPSHPDLSIPDLDITYIPKLRYREAYYYDTNHNPLLAMHLKLNGQHNDIPESLGGHYQFLGWCHTSFSLLPPAKYFAAHPDWYSLQGKKRETANGQLCWSNPEMRAELVKNALEWIEKNPNAGIISISQNDCIGNCQCDKCKAIDAAEGSPAGSLIAGINAIAGEIGKKYPNFLVETLAYQYTRNPPKTIRPAKNVLVRLCSIEADGAHPLNSAANRGFGNDLEGWSKIAPNLFVWNYVTNFNFHLVPHPNIPALGPDLNYFAKNNVIGVFEQGDDQNMLAGDLLPLRVWLMAHLMWDPSRDEDKLIDEFCNGYYGAAGPSMKRYIELTQAPAKDEKFSAGCFNRELAYISDAMLRECHKAFDAAESAVRASPALLARVKRDRLVLEHLELQRYDIPGHIAELQKTSANPADAAATAVHDYEMRAGDWAARALMCGMKWPGNYSYQPFENYSYGVITRGRSLLPPAK